MGALHNGRTHDFDRGEVETLARPLHRRASCIAAAAAISAATLWSAVFALARVILA